MALTGMRITWLANNKHKPDLLKPARGTGTHVARVRSMAPNAYLDSLPGSLGMARMLDAGLTGGEVPWQRLSRWGQEYRIRWQRCYSTSGLLAPLTDQGVTDPLRIQLQ
jgi:hypothetical protein